MKKIEFFVSDEKLKTVDKIRKKETFTRAELMRRALDLYIQTVAPSDIRTSDERILKK